MEITVKAESILRSICEINYLSYKKTFQGITFLLMNNRTKPAETLVIPISDKLYNFDIDGNKIIDID